MQRHERFRATQVSGVVSGTWQALSKMEPTSDQNNATVTTIFDCLNTCLNTSFLVYCGPSPLSMSHHLSQRRKLPSEPTALIYDATG